MSKSVKTGQTVYIVIYPDLIKGGDDTVVMIKKMSIVSDEKRYLLEPGIIMDSFPRSWLNNKLKRYPKGVAPVMFRTRGRAIRWAKLNGKVIHE